VTPEAHIRSQLEKALDRWRKLTGVDERKKDQKLTFRFTGISTYDIKNASDMIVEFMELDTSCLTSFMLLRGQVDEYLDDMSFTAKDFMDKPAEVADKLMQAKELRAVLEDPAVIALVSDFETQILGALTAYGATDKIMVEAKKLVADKTELAYVRRDALRSIKTLEPYQFLQGDGDPNPPKYNKSVYEFWNINSLLAAMRQQDFPGITLALMRDPVEALNSYFVFGIRNGMNITILTDFERGPHPAYSRMSRRPDRNLEERAEKHRFPYGLLDLKVSEDQKHIYTKARTALVPINAKAVALYPLSKMSADILIWIILVFDLIRERYWRLNFKLPQLAYTGEMVRDPQALIGVGAALVRSGDYKPLALAPLTPLDVNEKATEHQFERKTTGWNRWMEEAYAAKVPQEALNVVGAQEQKFLESGENKALAPFYDKWGHDYGHLEVFQPTCFGTAEQLAHDRQWAGRVNACKVMQFHAKEEYEREKDSVIDWAKERLERNRDFLLDAFVRGELMMPQFSFRGEVSFERGYVKTKQVNALTWGCGKTPSDARVNYYGWIGVQLFIHGGHRERPWRIMCADRPDHPAMVYGTITPNCPAALAILFGVPEEMLPSRLSNWSTDEPYYGNSILDRIDPQDWVLKNPWQELNFHVGLALSKRAYHARRKALGLEPKVLVETKREKAGDY
jgi:hypothetical protein